MRNLFLAGLALALCAGPAWADDDVMASRYGNTIVVHLPNGGPVVHMYYNADHTFSGRVKTGQQGMPDYILHGTWKIEGNKICNTYDPLPPGQKNPSCNTIDAHNVGDTWTAEGRTITIVPGIQ
ncbi:MAG TPA: hypothetical protein VMH86_07120 [Rhizomicrobium sp.]|nr:hypothetical protein [Rhizomicrobium sp.]